MSKNKIYAGILALLIILLTAGYASADTLAGRGWLRAQGNGTAILSGNIATATIEGEGVLWYKDKGRRDIPRVTGYEHIIRYPNGWVEIIGFHGTFHLDHADEVTIKITGREIDLFAIGSGRVWLRGEGRYVYGTGDFERGSGDWSEEGEAFDLNE